MTRRSQQARTLIQQKKARHLLALSRNDLERRHEKAVREIWSATPASLSRSRKPNHRAAGGEAGPRRRAKSRQHAEALSG